MTTIINYIYNQINNFFKPEDFRIVLINSLKPNPGHEEESKIIKQNFINTIKHNDAQLTQHHTIKAKTPEELSVVINELRQQLNII